MSFAITAVAMMPPPHKPVSIMTTKRCRSPKPGSSADTKPLMPKTAATSPWVARMALSRSDSGQRARFAVVRMM